VADCVCCPLFREGLEELSAETSASCTRDNKISYSEMTDTTVTTIYFTDVTGGNFL